MSEYCFACPRKCGADRSIAAGFCGMPERFKVARAALHFWEEPCISGTRGSGTVFFSGCSLQCVYCQNREISHGGFGKEISDDRLLEIFDALVEAGAHNINLVSPTHYAPRLAKLLAKKKPPVPIVYNTSGYERTETLRALEGLADIYLTDLKYYDASVAEKYSGAADYFDAAAAAIGEMRRQQPEDVFDADGLLQKGVIVRHLILPGNVSQMRKTLDWVADHCSTRTIVSLMRQYTPCGEAKQMPPLDRRVTAREYALAKQHLLSLGFSTVFLQDAAAATEDYIPPFDLTGV